jgi:hypothetical protein
MTNTETEQTNKTDGDLDALDDRRAPPTSAGGKADETHPLRPFEPTAPHGPHVGQYFAHSGVATPTPDLAPVGP